MKKSQIIAMLFSATLLILFGACQQPKAEESNKVEDFQLDGPSGKLACVLQTPSFKKGEKVPLVILMHGITAQKNDSLMVKLAAKLHEAGLATIRFDFDGHGASEGNFQDMTVPKEIADADVVYVYAMKLPYVKNISLLGHSQGGVVASILAGELGDDKVKSLVLMAPAAVLKDDALNGTSLGAKFDPNNIPDSIPIFKGLALGKDYIKSAQQLPIYEIAGQYKGDVCIIHGREDKVVNESYAIEYHKIYAKSELHLMEYEDHSFNYDMNKSIDIAVRFLKDETK